MPEGSYFGGKGGAGTYQTLINQIPPHDLYIEPFLGFGRILRHKKPAAVSHGIELDPETLAAWNGDEVPGLTLHHGCGIAWLRHHFELTRWPAPRKALRPGEPVPFIFVDPPYPLATRSKDRYRFEMTDDQHREQLDTLKQLPAGVLVMVTSYPNDLYAKRLRSWRTFSYQNSTRGGPRIEQAWCNYPEPVRLHDSRFIGRDKRERERLNKRRRNWRREILRVPPQERQAIMDALIEATATPPAEPPNSATPGPAAVSGGPSRKSASA